MTRYTVSNAEIIHLVKMNEQIPMTGIVLLELMNGQTIEGLITAMSTGNNAGKATNASATQYYGNMKVTSADGKSSTIDFLDVKSARDVSIQRMPEFERLGIVRIVDTN